MKTFKKFSILFSAITIISVFIVIASCSSESVNDNEEYVYSSGKISLNEYLNSSDNYYQSRNSSNEDIIIETVFVSNIEIPENLDDEDLTSFLVENSNILEGEFTFIMNDEVAYVSTINDSQETASRVSNSNINFRINGDCSYEGIRQCTIAKIDALSDFQKVVCAFRRGCVLVKIGECISENC